MDRRRRTFKRIGIQERKVILFEKVSNLRVKRKWSGGHSTSGRFFGTMRENYLQDGCTWILFIPLFIKIKDNQDV